MFQIGINNFFFSSDKQIVGVKMRMIKIIIIKYYFNRIERKIEI